MADTGSAPRVERSQRRDMLLDVAAELALDGGPDMITMELVAERAGVSRPLVYKHFANRDDLLAAVYRRDARRLHRELVTEVEGAESVEDMFRALIHGALSAAGQRGRVFAVLRTGSWTRDVRKEQRRRDATTAAAFSARVESELGADPHRSRPVVSLLLASIDAVLSQWRHDPTPERAARLEEAYMQIVAAALESLHRPAPDELAGADDG